MMSYEGAEITRSSLIIDKNKADLYIERLNEELS